MRLSVTVDVLRVESHDLGTSHTGELCRHGIATEGNGSNRGRATQDRNLARGDRGVEGEDSVVSAGFTIFHSRLPAERHTDVEASGGAMSQSGGGAHQVHDASAS